MKKFMFVAAALMLPAAAMAQMPPPGPGWNGGPGPGGPGGPGWHRGGPWDAHAFWRGAPDDPYQRIQFLQDRVAHGMSDGSLNPYEAGRVNRELNGLRHWIQRKHWQDHGPLDPGQRAQVQGRLDQISQQIRWMRHNG